MKNLSDQDKELRKFQAKLQSLRKELIDTRKTLSSMQTALEKEKKHYWDMFEEAPDANLVTDSDCLVLEANSASMKMLGDPDLVGKSLSDFIDEDHRSAFKSTLIELLLETGPVHLEFRIRPKNGTAFNAAIIASMQIPAHGESPRIRWAIRNSTAWKQLEPDMQQPEKHESLRAVERLESEIAEIHERSKMLRAFFELTNTPLAFMDKSFQFILVNEAFARMMGTDPDHFAGRNFFECFPSFQDKASFEQVAKTGRPYHAYDRPYDFPCTSRRGTTYWDIWLVPILGSDREIESLVLDLKDVTERQRAISELNRRAKQLQKLSLELSQAEDRERHRLAEILHDDLQQVLVAAKFHLALLGNLPQESSSRMIIAEIEHMISDAIQKSRNLSHELSPAVLHRNDFSEIAAWLANQVYLTHGLEVAIKSPRTILVRSEPLRVFLFRSTQELLFNVVKHARVNHATIRIREIRNCVCISVVDQGRGFDPDELSESEGFGLFSIRERVQLLGGHMRIKSTRGKGSISTIIIPNAEPATGGFAQTAFPTDAQAAGKNRLRVLIADDHEIVREGLASLLSEQKDMEVVAQAGNGREAVNLAGELRPDVVVMDASMPLMNGDEATRQIKTYLPETRVVVLSMFEQEEMVQRMYRAGVEGYVSKTAPPDELLAAIRSQAH
jgi:PAS domain S-box-containing protein